MPEDQNVSREATAVSDATRGNRPDLNPDRQSSLETEPQFMTAVIPARVA
jgi:hypothetical protein